MDNVEQFGVEDTDTYEEALNKVVSEVMMDWAWRVSSGTPNVSDPTHLTELRTVLNGFKMDTQTIKSVMSSLE